MLIKDKAPTWHYYKYLAYPLYTFGNKKMSDQKKLYVGIDIHRREQVVTILPLSVFSNNTEIWKKSKPITIKNNIKDYELLDSKIRSHLTDINQICIAIDYTGGYYSAPITYFLVSKGYNVVYLTSNSVKAAKERFLKEENKTDKLDSAVIAYLMYARDSLNFSLNIAASVPNLETKAALLRSLVLQRKQYVKLAGQANNKLHQYLLAVFPEGELYYFNKLLKVVPYYPIPEDMIHSDGLKDISGLTDEKRNIILSYAKETVGIPGQQYRWIIKDVCAQRVDAIKKCNSITRIIASEIEKHPYGDILCSFPYVGSIISATIIGIIKDIDRWQDKNKFKKVLGVYGREYLSGDRDPIRKTGRSGNRDAKNALYQACFLCIRNNATQNDFKDYYEKQLSNGKIFIKAILATMGKMAEIMFHCLKNEERYQYQGKYKIHK